MVRTFFIIVLYYNILYGFYIYNKSIENTVQDSTVFWIVEFKDAQN